MNKRYLTQVIIASLSFNLLTGFIFSNPEDEVGRFIKKTENEIKQSKQVKLPPMPEIKPYHPFEYQADKADPFKLLYFVLGASKVEDESSNIDCTEGNCGDPPPAPHAPYFLENYEMSALQMIGTLENEKTKQKTVLIQTPDAGVVKTKVGEYIGRNNGLILSIDEDHIVIQEKYKIPRGWQNRTATMDLVTSF